MANSVTDIYNYMPVDALTCKESAEFARRQFELTNHLGNVLAVVSDKKLNDNEPDVVSTSDYFPFGMTMPNRSLSGDYRFGFNGVEKDDEVAGAGNYSDFKFRGYSPRTGQFWSVDPLARSYAGWSPYAFAQRRPIDGIDLEGLEWNQSTDGQGNINISVNIDFSVDKELGLNSDQIQSYQNAIHNQLNTTLQISFGDKYSGQVTFNGGTESGQVIPTLNIYGTKPESNTDVMIGGMASFQGVSVNIYGKDGEFRNPTELAVDAVHELLHTLRLGHPFEITQGCDTELIHQGGNNYLSTSTTDQNILHNIMNYSITNINGQNPYKPMIYLTNDQLNLMMIEIGLQKQGAGTWREDYWDYWLNMPGENVLYK